MTFSLTYDLEGVGWATVQIQDGKNKVDVTVSYLHDTLRELGEAALALRNGADSVRVVFMDEPGEVHFLGKRRGDSIDYELRWFHDWNSWGMHPDDQFKTFQIGSLTIVKFCEEVQKEFAALLAEYGVEGYKEKWREHEFPTDLFRELKRSKR
ncbi:MAG: hypothetical protein QM627_02370 [Luteolibacter sp.]